MSYIGQDNEFKFEEENFGRLVEKFLKKGDVERLWEEFVFQEYNDTLNDNEPEVDYEI